MFCTVCHRTFEICHFVLLMLKEMLKENLKQVICRNDVKYSLVF